MASSESRTYTVVAEFSDASGFLNGLSPNIEIMDQTLIVIDSGVMDFSSDGLYSYSFTGNTNTLYVWRADIGASYPHPIRYASAWFKDNVVGGTDIRDALLEDPDASIAPGRESIDNKIRRLELMVDKVMQFFNIPKNYRR